MTGFLSTLLFFVAGLVSLGIIAATGWPARRRIIALLREGTAIAPVATRTPGRVVQVRFTPAPRPAPRPAMLPVAALRAAA
ncbi:MULTISPECIES: hypothetical protein [unclassified Sphingomonas]|uniref:hypothetical protein n=1 Tax=unclassified Sphingomonas TaxID=196159 RepID=UPI00082BE47F|nr:MULTISPECIES: hypothetical protein [unclassified Sphingomonas]